MAEIKSANKVKLFIGMISVDETICIQSEQILSNKFGEIDFRSPILPFHYTAYYEKEMGKNLIRQFIAFSPLIDSGKLASIKIWTNKLEQKLSTPNRIINLDPGYLTGAKIVLASTKDYSHRIYLQKSIYAEVTLRYRNNTFQPFDYTYPDYALDYIPIFNQMREIYLKQFKNIS